MARFLPHFPFSASFFPFFGRFRPVAAATRGGGGGGRWPPACPRAPAMAPLLLLPLLAGLQLQLPPPAAALPPPPPPAPPAPSLTVTPQKSLYLIGDVVALRCAAPPGAGEVRGFQLWGTGGRAVEATSRKRSHVFSLSLEGPRDGGWHRCSYSVAGPLRRPLRSLESPPVPVPVKERPPAPRLSAQPWGGRAMAGQPLLLRCDATPAPARPRRFRLRRGVGAVTANGTGVSVVNGTDVEVKVNGSWAATWALPRATPGLGGNYSCGYEQEEAPGRWVASWASPPLEVVVEEAAPPPRLESVPPGGVVGAGQPLALTCRAPQGHFPRRFRFYRDGAELHQWEPQTAGISAQIHVPHVPPAFGGRFSCRVEEDAGGTWVLSPPSPALQVTVEVGFQLVPVVAGCAAGGAAGLLGVLLAIGLWRRRRGSAHWKGLRDSEVPGGYPMATVSH